MADYSCVYVLDCGAGGIIRFNDGVLGKGQLGRGSTDDLYWIAVINGLDGPTLRVPMDDVPFGDGGIVHRSWKGPRHLIVEGSLLVQSVGANACQAVFNQMEEDLNIALDSIIAPTAGSLTWTPAGGSEHVLEVFYEVSLDIQPTENYRLRSFNFGLVAESADILAST